MTTPTPDAKAEEAEMTQKNDTPATPDAVREAHRILSNLTSTYELGRTVDTSLAHVVQLLSPALSAPQPAPGKADAEERETLQLIDERDAAEEALSQAYYVVTGNSPEWSNNFGHGHALEDIAQTVQLLKDAARPAPSPSPDASGKSPATAPSPDPAGGLVQAIMNLPCDDSGFHSVVAIESYRSGHRDARHAAAELVAASSPAASATPTQPEPQ